MSREIKNLKIGGVERPLRFSTAAKAEYAAIIDQPYSVVEGGGFAFNDMNICKLLYCCLKHTARQVGDAPALPNNFSWETVADWNDEFPDEKVLERGVFFFFDAMGVDLSDMKVKVEQALEEAEEKKSQSHTE